jgi:hypothetical protein
MMCDHGASAPKYCAICRHQPTLPYAGTSGWSGSQTSFERVKIADKSGATAKYQKMFLSDLRQIGNQGLTSREWGLMHEFEHQTYSSVPSVLHLGGFVARLTQRRGRHQVYVLPEWVNDRTLAPHKSNQQKIVTCPNCGHDLDTK